MRRGRLGTSLYAGLLFTVLGGIAWASGELFIFPSLGPSAFILAFERSGERTRTYRVVGGHLIGAGAGFLAHAALANGIAITTAPPPTSSEGLWLALSGVASIIATSWGMIVTDTIHAPACATTLIISLGLLSTPIQVVIIVVSVVILVEFHNGILWVYSTAVNGSSPPLPAE